MTLQEMLDKTPTQWKPVVTQYGPALVAMTAQQFADWLNLLVKGNTTEAFAALLTTPEATLGADAVNLAEWKKANDSQSENLAVQRAAAMAVLKILLGVVLAAAGL